MAFTREDTSIRSTLALWVAGASVVGIIGVSVAAIGFATSTERPEMARLVFASVLPLLGTWVGTVLAFYFVKENLQAASATTLDALKAAGTFGSDSLVKEAMTPLSKISPLHRVDGMTGANSLKLRDLHNSMKGSQNSRVPIITTKDVALLVIHEPDIDKFAQEKSMKATDLPDADTVEQLRQVPTLKAAVERFAAVGEAATIADARKAMGKIPECKDVFVTNNGKTSGKILGWLTNSDLARSN